MNDLISIIVPIYNVEKYLKKCLESIINQTYENLEIILVNDGSTDRCGEICEEFTKKDKRIKVIHKENGGLSDARNVGIKNAMGSFIGFVDSDDYIHETMYEMLYHDLKKYDGDIAICEFQDVDENGKGLEVFKKSNSTEGVEILNKIDALHLLIEGRCIQSAAWNKLYKIELFKNIEFPKGRVIEDRATMYKIFDKVNKIINNKKVCYYYVQRKNSIMHTINCKLIMDSIITMNERYNDLIKYIELKDILVIDKLSYIADCAKIFYEIRLKDKELEEILNKEYIFYKRYYKEYQKKLGIHIKNNIEKRKQRRLQFEAWLLYLSKRIFKIYSIIISYFKGIFRK